MIGAAVGDALGLPYEGMAPKRTIKLMGKELRHSFLPGIGMISDDTDHAILTAQSLLLSPDNPDEFARIIGLKTQMVVVEPSRGTGFSHSEVDN